MLQALGSLIGGGAIIAGFRWVRSRHARRPFVDPGLQEIQEVLLARISFRP
jgi:hypothetical protein